MNSTGLYQGHLGLALPGIPYGLYQGILRNSTRGPPGLDLPEIPQGLYHGPSNQAPAHQDPKEAVQCLLWQAPHFSDCVALYCGADYRGWLFIF